MVLSASIGVTAAARALSLSRSLIYRHRRGDGTAPATEPGAAAGVEPAVPGRHHRALSAEQQSAVLEVLSSDRFCDRSPAQIVSVLLDEGGYIASERTMYRLLAREAPVKDRRQQARRTHYSAPELLATRPNQVWSWDITKLKGPTKGTGYHLYVILDIYSRCVVGWSVYARESEALAALLIRTACARQRVSEHTLTLHADRGNAMRSKSVAELLESLKVTKSHSRPYCSNDNPYSESQFKTMKYSPAFPERFSSLEDARSFCARFIDYYNHEHRHSGIAMMTPAVVHRGRDAEVIAHRDAVLRAAYDRTPQRFVRGVPTAARLPEAVWINKPADPAGTPSRSDLQIQPSV